MCPDDKDSISPDKLLEILLSDRPVLLVVGSGVSMMTPTELPLSWQIVDTCLEHIIGSSMAGRKDEERIRRKLREIHPESFFAILIEVLGKDVLRIWDILEKTDDNGAPPVPNYNHRALAELSIKHECPIITLNFDRMIEDASLQRRPPIPPFAPVPDKYTPWSGRAAGVWKVHGTIEDRSTMKTMVCSTHMRSNELLKGLENIDNECSRPDICLVGYSGRDGDIFPYLMSHAQSDVYWIDPKIGDEASSGHLYWKVRNKVKKGILIRCESGFEYFAPNILHHEGQITAEEVEHFDALAKSFFSEGERKRREAEQNAWISELVQPILEKLGEDGHQGERILLQGLCLYHAKMVMESNRVLLALVDGPYDVKKEHLFRAYLTIAENYFFLSDYDNYIAYSQKALRLAFLFDLGWTIQALVSLGFSYKMRYLTPVEHEVWRILLYPMAYLAGLVYLLDILLVEALYRLFKYWRGMPPGGKDLETFVIEHQRTVFAFNEHRIRVTFLLAVAAFWFGSPNRMKWLVEGLYRDLKRTGDGGGMTVATNVLMTLPPITGLPEEDSVAAEVVGTYLPSLTGKAIPAFYSARKLYDEGQWGEAEEKYLECIEEVMLNYRHYRYFEGSLLIKSAIALDRIRRVHRDKA